MFLPLWVRQFIRDTIEGGVGTAVALTVFGDAQTVLHAIGAGFAVAAVAAARHNLGGFRDWLNSVLGTTPDTSTSDGTDGPPVGS